VFSLLCSLSCFCVLPGMLFAVWCWLCEGCVQAFSLHSSSNKQNGN
jgi:hypothetical protein